MGRHVMSLAICCVPFLTMLALIHSSLLFFSFSHLLSFGFYKLTGYRQCEQFHSILWAFSYTSSIEVFCSLLYLNNSVKTGNVAKLKGCLPGMSEVWV